MRWEERGMTNHQRSILSLKRKRGWKRTEQAGFSLTVAFCLIGVCFLQAMMIRAYRFRMAEQSLVVRLEQGPRHYLVENNDLLRHRFGLWGVTQEAARKKQVALEKEGYWQQCEGLNKQSYQLGDSIWQSEKLKQQIVHYMRTRLPLSYVSMLGRLIKEGKASVEVAREEGQRHLVEVKGAYQQIKQVEQDEEGKGKSALEKLWKPLEVKSIEELESTGELEGNGLQKMLEKASDLEGLLNWEQGTALQKLDLIEYSLHQFPSLFQADLEQNKAYQYTRNYAGDLLQHRAKEGAATIEFLLTGNPEASVQKREAKWRLQLIRLLMRYADDHFDSAYLRKLDLYCGLISKSILVLTAGQVHLPPQLLREVYLLGKASRTASRDVKALLLGEGLALLEKKGPRIVFYYHDYLRLFLLMKQEEALLQLLSKGIQQEFPEPHYSSVELVLSWANPYELGVKRLESYRRKESYYVANP